MPKKDQNQTITVKPYSTQYGRTDIRRYAQALSKKNLISRILFLALILLLMISAIYLYYWAQSSKGQGFLSEAKEMISEGTQYITPSYWATRAKRIGTVWETDTNPESLEKGIIFKDFKSLVPEIPSGLPIQFLFDLELKNTRVDSLPITMSCSIKTEDKPIKGNIIPRNPITVSGTTITEAPVCRFPASQTQNLKGTIEAEGKVSFPFETKDAKLKVYLTKQEVKNQIENEDFFKYFKIKETLPISVTYNGEPIRVGIGATPKQIQPVILSSDINQIIGISLTNEWNGNMTKINTFNIYLPAGININTELSQNPSELCPFTKRRQGSDSTEYTITEKFKKTISLPKGESRSFMCWLDIDESIIGNANYIIEEYETDISYDYQLPAQKSIVKITEVNQQK